MITVDRSERDRSGWGRQTWGELEKAPSENFRYVRCVTSSQLQSYFCPLRGNFYVAFIVARTLVTLGYIENRYLLGRMVSLSLPSPLSLFFSFAFSFLSIPNNARIDAVAILTTDAPYFPTRHSWNAVICWSQRVPKGEDRNRWALSRPRQDPFRAHPSLPFPSFPGAVA